MNQEEIAGLGYHLHCTVAALMWYDMTFSFEISLDKKVSAFKHFQMGRILFLWSTLQLETSINLIFLTQLSFPVTYYHP